MIFLRALWPLLVLAACVTHVLTIERMRDARFVLLGEVHDNAEQHRQRAALLRDLLADGRPTVVVFEQMSRTRDAAIAAAPREAEAVAHAGQLDREAWRWPLHKPVLDAALAGGASVRGGNLERAVVRAIVRSGIEAAPPDVRAALAADSGWSPAQQQALLDTLIAGHCDALPASMHAPMALAQRARDTAMARAMLDAAPGTRVVLIAGNGHVRTDLGVPHYLREAGVPASEIVAIGFVERGAEHAGAPYDLLRTTAAARRDDPCAALRR